MSETAVVVGVGPGLGLALVNAFAAEGYTVLAAARNTTKTGALARDKRVVPFECDATNPEQVDALFERAASLGALRVAVFNAGTFARGTVVDTEPAQFERCWRVGAFGGFLVGRAAARRMQGSGTILFTGATASLRGGAGFVNLASPKFALRAVAQSMARELDPKGIHVAHVIIDGQIRSEERGGKDEADTYLDPNAIAQTYVALHKQHRSAWTQEIDVRPWAEKF
jgi:NAD(P)-dependent dehydrogenase (short-subunit alcohol dehydrogenase family)